MHTYSTCVVAHEVRTILHSDYLCYAGLLDCEYNVSWPTNVTFREVKSRLIRYKEDKDDNLDSLAESVLLLIRRNPQWGLR